MKSYRYKVVDVFTTEALKGNALAVFPDASDLDATAMQKIARELNLSETAFVLLATRKDCAARLRIFTPSQELAFAGHPTVGGAFVLLQEGIVPKNSSAFVVEEQIGPVGEQGADGIYVGGHVTPVSDCVMTLDSHADSKENQCFKTNLNDRA